MTETSPTTWLSVVALLVSTLGGVLVAYINRQNKPVRDILKKTKMEGSGSLVEALGVLQRQLKEEQLRHDRQLRDAQRRHEEEIAYYVEQLRISREENKDLRHEIARMRRVLNEHEHRLNVDHIGIK
jgi:hypothetical protein